MNTRLAVRISMVLFIATFLVYSQVVSHEFLAYDDMQYVVANPPVRNGLSWDGFTWAWTSFYAANWHPLTWLSHMADCQLFGLHAGAHHFINLLLHTANTVVLFLVLRQMTRETWRPAWVAALFAVHPLHVESVAWVAERKDVLSTLFGFLTLAAYARYAERPSAFRYALIVAGFVLSLLSKPMLVTLPFVLLLLDYWPLRRSGWRRLVLEKVPLLVLSAASCVATLHAQRTGGAVVALDRLPLELRLANVHLAYVTYLKRAFWPAGLAAFYPLEALTLADVLVSGQVLILATALALAVRRSAPAVPVGWFWYLGTLVPVIGLVQVGAQSAADRYTYVPLIGLFIALAWAVPDTMLERPRVRLGVCFAAAGILLVCAALTARQVSFWSNDFTLWQHARAVTRSNPMTEFQVGTALYRQGDVEAADMHLRAAVEASPNFSLALNSLGTSLRRQGRLDEAADVLTRALQAEAPFAAAAASSLGLTRYQQGQLAAACNSFRAATHLVPAHAEYWYNFATALEELGDRTEAAEAYRQALRLDPAWPPLADVLARFFLTTSNPKVRCPSEALFRAKQACQATQARDPALLETLAAAYAAVGDLAAATATVKHAAALASSQGKAELAQRLQAQVRGYEAQSAPKKHAP